MTKDEALKLALEALEASAPWVELTNEAITNDKAISDIKEALAQDELCSSQEPVACDWSVFNTGAEVCSGLSLADAVAGLTPDRLERGWSAVCVIDKDNPPLYTTPPQRPWVGLTDEQWQIFADTLECFITRQQKDIIETKLKKKNT